MAQCIKKNHEVAFKICKSTDDMSNFKAVIVEGQAKILTERDEISNGLKVLYAKLGLPESRIETRVNQLTADKDKISFYRIPLQNLGGKRAGTGEI